METVEDRAKREVDDVIAGMQGMIEMAPETGAKPGDIVSSGRTPDEPMPAIISTRKSAGYVYIYDTRTGEQSRTNRNMLDTQLSKRRIDGSQVFTTIDPKILPVRGNHRCLLHPDIRLPEYTTWGLIECSKANLASPQDVEDHMKHRHKRAWSAIERAKADKEKQDTRDYQERLLTSLVAQRNAPVDARPPYRRGKKTEAATVAV